MLLGLLLCGILVGALAAIVSLLAGFSGWAAFGFYVLGGVVGICASGLAMSARRRRRVVRPTGAAAQASADPKSLSSRG